MHPERGGITFPKGNQTKTQQTNTMKLAITILTCVCIAASALAQLPANVTVSRVTGEILAPSAAAPATPETVARLKELFRAANGIQTQSTVLDDFSTNSQFTGGEFRIGNNISLRIGGGATAMDLRIQEPSGSGTNYTGFKAPALAGDVIYTLPTADGPAGETLATNGSKVLSWNGLGTNLLVLKNNTGTLNATGVAALFATIAPTNTAGFISGTGTALAIQADTGDLLVTNDTYGPIYAADNSGNTEIGDVDGNGNGTKIHISDASGAINTYGELRIGGGTVGLTFYSFGQGTLNFGSIATQSEEDLTITVTGAQVGDSVALGVPLASVLSGVCYTAWVSATSQVTVRAVNYSAASKDPASGTFNARVFR